MERAWGVVAALCVVSACGSDGKATERSDGGVPDAQVATTDAGSEERDGGSKPMGPGALERDGAVREASRSIDRLRGANQVLSLFVKQDPTLDLAANACTNAKNVATRVSSAVTTDANTTCAEAKASCMSGVGSVTATLTSCSVGETGTTVSGSVTASVSKTTVNGVATLSVSLSLSDVAVTTTEDAYSLGGTISTSTSDLKLYAVSADMKVDSLQLTFAGTTQASESAEGVLEGITLDGKGTISGVSMSAMMGAASCTTSSVAYTATGLHRAFDECRADAGTVTLDETYTCTTTTTVRGKPRTTTSMASVNDVVTWSEQTPTDSKVHVVTSTTAAGQTVKAEKDVTLPGECQ